MNKWNADREQARITPIEPVERLDSASVQLANRLLRMLPHNGDGQLRALTGAIDALIGTDHEIFLHNIRVGRGEELPDDVGAAFVTEFWLPPDPEVGVMLIDMNVVEHWLETLLDDEPPRERRLSPLTPRDFGLATFVLLHAVDSLKQAGFPPVVLSSEPPARAETLSSVREVERVAEVVFGATSERSAGLIRLFLPLGMVQSLESFSRASGRAGRRLQRLVASNPDTKIPLRASLGFTWLTPSELDYLEDGDVVFPTAHALDVDGVAPGESAVVLGSEDDPGVGWTGTVRPSESGVWQLQVQRYTQLQEREMSHDMVEEDQTEMIERASVRVEFSFGDVMLPLSELAELKPGYVLETDRDVGDGVDILASGRKVASGELVSIEGKLGVRVVSVDH
ncbi:MAG: FliM/FliN family flagellar motor switch protein [Myxococcota bacterium]